eukprot:NODE_1070_length_2342_cov_0.531431.p2 type:complete len:147 gc:universal NODE_1070_length_2342_cov_0.531431:1809-1369(-)
MVSFITINGRLTEDPIEKIVKTIKGEKKVTELSIASNNYIGRKNHVSFYNVTLWEGRADRLKKTLKKGSCVVVNGQFYQTKYFSKDGQEKTANSVNLHSICLPVCEHPAEMTEESEILDDNDLELSSDKHKLEAEESKDSKRQKRK